MRGLTQTRGSTVANGWTRPGPSASSASTRWLAAKLGQRPAEQGAPRNTSTLHAGQYPVSCYRRWPGIPCGSPVLLWSLECGEWWCRVGRAVMDGGGFERNCVVGVVVEPHARRVRKGRSLSPLWTLPDGAAVSIYNVGIPSS